MAQVNLTLITLSGLMGLQLKHPDSIAQLLSHIVVLVDKQIVAEPNSVRVVSTHISDIRVTFTAKFSMPITNCRPPYGRSCEREGKGERKCDLRCKKY